MQVEDNLALISRGRGNYVDLARLQCPSKPARCPDRYGGFSCAQDYFISGQTCSWLKTRSCGKPELRNNREFEVLAHMFLFSSVMVGDSGMEASVGSWLTNELMLLLSRLSASVSQIQAIQQPAVQRQIGVDTGLPTRVS